MAKRDYRSEGKSIRVDYDLWVRVKAACPYLGESLCGFTEKALERRLAGLSEGVVDGKRLVVEVAWAAPGAKAGGGGVDTAAAPGPSAAPAVTAPTTGAPTLLEPPGDQFFYQEAGALAELAGAGPVDQRLRSAVEDFHSYPRPVAVPTPGPAQPADIRGDYDRLQRAVEESVFDPRTMRPPFVSDLVAADPAAPVGDQPPVESAWMQEQLARVARFIPASAGVPGEPTTDDATEALAPDHDAQDSAPVESSSGGVTVPPSDRELPVKGDGELF